MKEDTVTTDGYTQGKRKFTAKGFYILVELAYVPPISKGLIQVAGEEEKREMYLKARSEGIVRHMGSLAFSDEPEARCKIGDKVFFRPYSGTDANKEVDGTTAKDVPVLRWVIDKGIMGTIEDIEE